MKIKAEVTELFEVFDPIVNGIQYAEIDISAESLIRQLKEQGFQELNLNINCPPEPPKAPPDLREKILKTIEDWDSADSCEESYQELTNQILALLPKAPPEPQYCECVGGSRVSSHGKCWECGKPIKPTCEQIEEIEDILFSSSDQDSLMQIVDKLNELIRWTKREGR